MRSFIAIAVTEEVRRNLLAAMKELGNLWPGVRWVKPEGIHLTMKFLGDVNPDTVDRIVEVLKEVSASCDRFTVKVASLGRFPEKGKPRVVWAGVTEEKGDLRSLAEKVEMEMGRLGFEKEERSFKPHITLGRVKSPGQDEQGLRYIGKHMDTVFGSYEVDSFHLMKSTLLPDGARYEQIGSFALGKHE